MSGVTYFSVGVPIASPVTSPRESQRDRDYYYTLVFPNTKAADDNDSNNTRLRYADALATLRTITAGGKEREAQVVEEFCAAWIAKFRTPAPAAHDTISLLYFQELLRELIVQRFDGIQDLFLKTSVTQDQQSLLISFRPSKALLCATADRLQMKIAIMSEIDPGERYWSKDPTRVASEAYQWSRADAQEELYRMFLAGKISSEDAQLFDREDTAMWSRRIHALRRFWDPQVAEIVTTQDQMTTSTTTTHLRFKDHAWMHYLYRQIDGAGDDQTPFRVVDKIRLTKAIIDAQFDCDALVEQRLLMHHCCMHTHHTDAVDTSIDVLRAQWGALSSPLRLYRDGISRLSQLLHFQPIGHVRNYFGEELALYFAYTSFYAHSLLRLCVIALLVALLTAWSSPSSSSSSSSGLAMFAGSQWTLPSYAFYVAFAVANTAFTQAFVRKWKIHERVLATQWGVEGTSNTTPATTATRPQFRGQLAVSSITHRLETFYSPQKRQLQRLASALLLLLVSLGLLSAGFVLLTSRAYMDVVSSSSSSSSSSSPSSSSSSSSVSAPSSLLLVHVGVALVAKSLSGPLATLCKSLTDWENYKCQHNYDANLTLKFAIVQSVNLFGVLWLQTFVLPLVAPQLQQLQPQDQQQSLSLPLPPFDGHWQAAHLLTTMLAVELVVSLWDLRHAVVSGVVGMFPCSFFRSSSSTSAEGDRARLLDSSSASSPSSCSAATAMDTELALTPYEGVLFDYAQVTTTFGFVALFAPLAPLTALIAWGVALVQIRVDAFKLCQLTQRPFPTQKNTIGSWATYLHALAFGAWLHNAMLTVLYVSDHREGGLADLSDFVMLRGGHDDSATGATVEEQENRRLATETLVLVTFMCFACVSFLASVHDQKDRAQFKQLRSRDLRNRFLENKYINNLDRVPDTIRDALPSGRVFLNGVHLYVVTGNKAEEDAAEEILDELLQLQQHSQQLTAQIRELRAADAPVGVLHVEAGSISILPVMDALTKSVDSFLQLQLTATPSKNDASLGKPKSASGKAKAKPVNTRVIKKSRSPQWTESFSLPLRSLDDDDALLVRVFDWDLVGKNRRIGHATLAIGDILTTAPPVMPAPVVASATGVNGSGELLPPPQSLVSSSSRVRMASFEVALDMPQELLSTMHTDLIKHGHPKLTLRCGVQLDALGRLLLQHRRLQHKIHSLKQTETQFFQWK